MKIRRKEGCDARREGERDLMRYQEMVPLEQVSRSGSAAPAKQKFEFRHDFSSSQQNPGAREPKTRMMHVHYCNLETSNRSSLTTMTHI